MCAHQQWRCSPTKDGSWEEDEDEEVEEVGSPQKRKRVSMDKGSRDKKGKKRMTEADWEVEMRWRDQVEARLESMNSVLRKIAVRGHHSPPPITPTTSDSPRYTPPHK